MFKIMFSLLDLPLIPTTISSVLMMVSKLSEVTSMSELMLLTMKIEISGLSKDTVNKLILFVLPLIVIITYSLLTMVAIVMVEISMSELTPTKKPEMPSTLITSTLLKLSKRLPLELSNILNTTYLHPMMVSED